MSRVNLITFACMLALLLTANSPALAQRSFGSRSNSLISIAGNDLVQKELGISGDEAKRLSALNDEYRAASQKEFTAMGIDYSAITDLPQAERAVEMRKVNEKTAEVTRKLTAEFGPKLVELVTAEQMLRMKQIQLQANGLEAWTEAEWAALLGLSDDQRQKLESLKTEYARRQQSLDGDFQQRFARMRELSAERDKKGLDVLSADQRTKLTALQGAPFDVTQLGFGRRRNNQ